MTTGSDRRPAVGFHSGELAVQQRAGVGAEARRLAGMLDTPELNGGIGRFLAERTFAAVTGRDHRARLWISALVAPPGFLAVAGPTTLRVHTAPAPGDPLHALPAGQPVGLLTVDFARRRRVRINGTLTRSGQDGLTVQVDQAYGNCPQYIRPRLLEPVDDADRPTPVAPTRRSTAMDRDDVELVRRADTFLLGTTHPDRGSDASHRGGPPGFVRVADDRTLWWPDYPGNNMFNSLGNLAVDPTAALLFLDFTTGATLHLSGTARLDWTAGDPGDDGDTGRRVRFAVEAVTAGPPVPLRTGDVVAHPHHPSTTA